MESLRPVPRGRARVAHPLADRGPRRHADGAAAARGLGLAAARRAGPDATRPTRQRSTRRCARRHRSAFTSRAGAAARCSCPATGGPWTSAPTSAPGPRFTSASRWSSRRSAPRPRGSSRAAARSSGSRRRAGRAARARAAAGRALPRQPGRHAAAVPRSRSPAARASRSVAAGGGRHESTPHAGARAGDLRRARLVRRRALGERPRRRRSRRARVRVRPDRRRRRGRARAHRRAAAAPRGACCASAARSRGWARASWRSGSTGSCSRPRTGTSSATASTAGFAALGTVQWPYDGTEPWADARSLLLAIPLVLSIAAALAFWPRQGARARSRSSLLVALYGMAVTEHQFDAELARGRGPPRAHRGLALAAADARARVEHGRRRRRRRLRGVPGRAARGRSLRGPRAAGRLRVVEPVRGAGGDALRLVALVRPDRLAARRQDADERALGRAQLLEGRDARPVRRAPLGAVGLGPGQPPAASRRRTA